MMSKPGFNDCTKLSPILKTARIQNFRQCFGTFIRSTDGMEPERHVAVIGKWIGQTLAETQLVFGNPLATAAALGPAAAGRLYHVCHVRTVLLFSKSDSEYNLPRRNLSNVHEAIQHPAVIPYPLGLWG